ncbi:hypothetical protein [Halonatronum saccharophilum]|uniref:hypothetical protein n=1 Tax=Halonatronum saccharophilum TaxID=150060 RepID=UPI0004863D82|nr:hypothetical protein [Halonatronum saccharophilum]
MKRVRAHSRIKAFILSDSVLSAMTKTFDIDLLPKVSVIECGVVVGEVKETGKARLYTRANVKNAGADITELELDVPVVPFVVGDKVSIGESEVNITGVDYKGKAITVDSAVTVSEGDAIKGTDGSETAIGLLRNNLELVGNFADEDQQEAVVDVGVVAEDMIDLLDDNAKEDLKGITFRKINR